MTKIRTKLILIFLGIALLPLVPIIWLVNDMVHQSYQIGVNPQVESALESGVAYSRELYQRNKTLLSEALAETVVNIAQLQLPDDSENWRFLSLQIYDGNGKLLAQKDRVGAAAKPLNASHFSQLAETAGQKIVFSDRAANRFIALEMRRQNGRKIFVSLTAALDENFLKNSQHSLDVYQLYRTLSLSPASIPRKFLYAFLLLSALVVLATVGIAVRLSKRLTQPIGELVKGTQEVGRGNLDYRVAAQNGDEIGELVRHFNRMAGELKDFQEKTIYLEKMAAWQEIARRLAHEIKNPLTPIQLTIQEMVDQYDGSDGDYQQLLQECHTIINEEIENLRRLVREFSDFGRMPALQLSDAHLPPVIEDVRKLYPHREIELKIENDIPPLKFDEDRVRRVLINLIENAIQADSSGQPIIISARNSGNFVEINVRDRGGGIASTLQQKIFQPYVTTKKQGVGLGLAITRKIVEEHDGTIRVDSEPGKGSVFTVRLPVK